MSKQGRRRGGQRPGKIEVPEKPRDFSRVHQVRCINAHSVPTDRNSPSLPLLKEGRVYRVLDVVRESRGEMYVLEVEVEGPENRGKFIWSRFEVV